MAGTSNLPDFFVDEQFGETDMAGLTSPDDIFSILEALEGQFSPWTSPLDETIFGCQEISVVATTQLVSQKSTSSSGLQEDTDIEPEPELPSSPISKRQKLSDQEAAFNSDGQQKISHITVERNRRKQINEHLTILRTIMPCFYVKRGDQASIVGGVVDYITELQQVLQSLEDKKQRKVYSDIVLSPRVLSSPRPSQALSPRKPPLSPKPNLPISPRTPQPQLPTSPYKPGKLQQATSGYNLSPTIPTAPSLEPSPSASSTTNSSINDSINEFVANSKSDIADVEVKFSGSNLLLKTISPRIPGQAMKIISTLEELSLEILHADIGAVDETTMVNSFTIKIGIGCQLSAEDLAQQIQQIFC